MTTTHASTAAPKPVETGQKPSQNNARSDAEKPAAADLFSTLLGLVSDTHAQPSTERPDAPAEAKDAEADTDGAAENPLAALLALITQAPGAGAGQTASTTDATTQAGAQAAPATDAEALRDGLDIEGMTQVDEAAPPLPPNAAAQARAAAASRPAFSPLNPGAPTAPTSASRTADGQAPQGSSTPAMVWQRGAVSSTEALQQQHAAQVRSTVALNERFGFSGAPEISAPALRELAGGSPGAMGTGSPLAQTPLSNTGQAVTGAAAADTTGGDHAAGAQSDAGTSDGQTPAEAGQDTEGPTVSHWGTQHLRHASLRVGEGAAEAIDIQLQVKGQEVQVAFQTDNAEARASLRESAGESLGDLLQRSGIQLGGVSVSSQGGSAPGGDNASRPTAGQRATAAIGPRSAAAEPASRPLPAPRADGSRPLDVFA